MQENEPVEDKVAEESERDEERHRRGTVIFRTELNGFWEKVEERDARDRTRRETENEVELVAESERKETADKGGDGRGQRDNKDDHDISFIIPYLLVAVLIFLLYSLIACKKG